MTNPRLIIPDTPQGAARLVTNDWVVAPLACLVPFQNLFIDPSGFRPEFQLKIGLSLEDMEERIIRELGA